MQIARLYSLNCFCPTFLQAMVPNNRTIFKNWSDDGDMLDSNSVSRKTSCTLKPFKVGLLNQFYRLFWLTSTIHIEFTDQCFRRTAFKFCSHINLLSWSSLIAHQYLDNRLRMEKAIENFWTLKQFAELSLSTTFHSFITKNDTDRNVILYSFQQHSTTRS